MSGTRDEYDDMTDLLQNRVPGSGRDGDDDLTRFLTGLRALGDVPAPPPSPTVAALLAGAHPRFVRRAAVRAVLVAALVISALVGAAATHRLPAPAQQFVSRVVNNLTPFHIAPPPPATSPARTHAPAPMPVRVPAAVPATSPAEPGGDAVPQPETSQPAERSGDSGSGNAGDRTGGAGEGTGAAGESAGPSDIPQQAPVTQRDGGSESDVPTQSVPSAAPVSAASSDGGGD